MVCATALLKCWFEREWVASICVPSRRSLFKESPIDGARYLSRKGTNGDRASKNEAIAEKTLDVVNQGATPRSQDIQKKEDLISDANSFVDKEGTPPPYF